MSDPSSIRAIVLVLCSPQIEERRRFYENVGLRIGTEQHGQGPATTQLSALPAASVRPVLFAWTSPSPVPLWHARSRPGATYSLTPTAGLSKSTRPDRG
jgi:hypothetical protein